MFAVYFCISSMISDNFSILIYYEICELARVQCHAIILNFPIFIILQVLEFTFIPLGSYFLFSALPCC